MRNETRELFNGFLDRQAELNEVNPTTVHGGKQFTATPAVQQTLETRQQESSDFLSRINISPVIEMKGERLGLGVGGPIASRTNTNTTDRATVDPTDILGVGYECVQTNSDTHLTYGKLDAWARFPDFQTRIRDAIIRRQALDRIMIGWNGTSAAAATDKVANPLLQDVNKGWLHFLRTNAPSRVFDEGEETGEIRVGSAAGADYKNLDALVMDACHNFLPTWARNDTELVAIVDPGLVHDKYFQLVNIEEKPTEKVAADVLLSQRMLGGKQAAQVPFFPTGSILITRFDNLSLYYQDGKRRRTVVDNAKRNRVENYESSNDAYVLEDTDFACLIENVTFTWDP